MKFFQNLSALATLCIFGFGIATVGATILAAFFPWFEVAIQWGMTGLILSIFAAGLGALFE